MDSGMESMGVKLPHAPGMYRFYAGLLRREGDTEGAAEALAYANACQERIEAEERQRIAQSVAEALGCQIAQVEGVMDARAAGTKRSERNKLHGGLGKKIDALLD